MSKLTKSEIMKAAHKLTKEMKAANPSLDYKTQLSINMKELHAMNRECTDLVVAEPILPQVIDNDTDMVIYENNNSIVEYMEEHIPVFIVLPKFRKRIIIKMVSVIMFIISLLTYFAAVEPVDIEDAIQAQEIVQETIIMEEDTEEVTVDEVARYEVNHDAGMYYTSYDNTPVCTWNHIDDSDGLFVVNDNNGKVALSYTEDIKDVIGWIDIKDIIKQ